MYMIHHPVVRRRADNNTIIMADNTSPVTSSGTINSYDDGDADEFGDGVPFEQSTKRREKRAPPPAVPLKRFKPNPVPVTKTVQPKKAVEGKKIEIPPMGLHTNGMRIEPPKVSAKPPLPPKPPVKLNAQKVKRKLEELNSANMMQKLTAQAEQLRLEVSQLKVALSTERNAVRVLRAQNDSESRRLKGDIKRLQDNLQTQKSTSFKRSQPHQTHQNDSQEITRLNQEISHLKEECKALEEKYQISSENDKRRVRELAELKDSCDKKLNQTIKSEVEIQRLLEELKTKERNLNHLKKELSLIKEAIEKNYPLLGAHFSHQMRKLKDFEHVISETVQSNCSSNSNYEAEHCNQILTTKTPTLTNMTSMTTTTTCGDGQAVDEHAAKDHSHEIIDNRLEEVEAHMKQTTTTKNPTAVQKERTITVSSSDLDSALSSAPTSLSPQPGSCPDSPVIWPKERDKCNDDDDEDEEAKFDYQSEENEVLHQELDFAREQVKDLEQEIIMLKDDDKSKKYKDRMERLEHKEAALIKELHELREQNELLEFRIIELEEAHDKWSIRNTSSTPGTKDVWTDTEKESDDIVLSDRSDSGVTSPNSHHHLDDRQSVSPCDLSLLDQISTEDVRKRIRLMSKRACYDEDDKLCLMQVLNLLNSGESSRDSETGSLGASSSDDNSFKPSDSETSHLRSLSLVSASPFKNQGGKIVATVQPYSSSNEELYRRNSSPQESTSSLKKRSWCSTSLQESGVFEGDLVEVSTQTALVDFPNKEKTNAELCAEIEKLNRFREKVEESRNLTLLPPDNCDQRRLQYYKDRLAILENKILIYESSGDQQMKHLADRLQREVQLESIVKQYSDRISKLEFESRRLEDERNELEEIENDTRLVNQRLEIEMEVMGQRNIELEISKDSYLEKYQEAKESVACLEECLQKCEERIFVLEEHENDLKHQLELISGIVPVVGAYCAWKMKETLEAPATECNCNPNEQLQGRINELLNREKELTQNISELNRAYNETLENADNLWAQMEKDYKERIAKYEDGELSLKAKLNQLEERLEKDSIYAQERITHLEESEGNLKDRITKLIKENKEIMAKNAALLEECRQLKEEYAKLRKYIDGPANDALEKEKKKIKLLEDELLMATKMLKHTEDVHHEELVCLKGQLKHLNKELTHTEVTNSELKEEVETLETRIKELARQRSIYEEKIRYLTEELRNKERAVKLPYLTERSLAQELARPIRRNYSSDSSSESSRRSTEFLDRLEETKPQRDFRCPNETSLMNAETRVCRATKRTFVEEVSPIRLRGGADDDTVQSPNDFTLDVDFFDTETIEFVVELDEETGSLYLSSITPLNANGRTTSLDATVTACQTDRRIKASLVMKPDLIKTENPSGQESFRPLGITANEFSSPILTAPIQPTTDQHVDDLVKKEEEDDEEEEDEKKNAEDDDDNAAEVSGSININKQESPCKHHRVKKSDEYECHKNSGGIKIDKQDILLDNLRKTIDQLKERAGLPQQEEEEQQQEGEHPMDEHPLPCSTFKKHHTTEEKPECPVQVLCVHTICENQLLVHWKPIARLPISGYEIDIDGVPSAKIYSAIRTSALLYDVNLSTNHLITIYAIPCPNDPNPDPIFCSPACFTYIPNARNCCRCP